ncbi:MAG: hypothetical protein QOF66_4208 [Mycobacterium sp.]|jgi:hypothetical protein|nr:hypothetical protein [Mycobacterium sp.]MDT5055842.1 hypothetical protein [Mycobacterium sp.]
MKPGKIIATLAIVGGVAAGAAGVSAGVANADPGPNVGPAPVWGPLHRHHGTATDMDGMEMDGAVADGTVPDGAAVPRQVAGTAAGSRGVGYAYSAWAYRTGSTTAEHQPHQDATGGGVEPGPPR